MKACCPTGAAPEGRGAGEGRSRGAAGVRGTPWALVTGETTGKAKHVTQLGQHLGTWAQGRGASRGEGDATGGGDG